MKEVETDHEIFADLLPRRMFPKRRRKSTPVLWEWGYYNHIDDDWNFFKTLKGLIEHLRGEGSSLYGQISFNKYSDSQILLKRRGEQSRSEDEAEVTVTGLPEEMEYGHKTPKRFVGQVSRALHLRTVGAP